jgi:hypothetical protein
LFYLVGLCLPTSGLKIQNFLYARFRQDVMIALYPHLETEIFQEVYQLRKPDVRIGVAA